MTDITNENRQPWPRSEQVSALVSLKATLIMVFTVSLDCLVAWQQRAAQRRHLNGLDDYLLKDMGISRADVDREVRKPFWQL